ncbi:MAG: hypothetical protein A3K22_04585 [Deltaproteobacteria bacterium RBG_16_42_7]|nr:MAG: hypothetical protein A3K22_04585 [Deltaproteobacteria bacterium RBG_16_42_7]
MKKIILTALLAFGLGLGLTLIASTPSMAVHRGFGALACGGCHTMHNSQGGGANTLGGNAGGSLVLLRGAVATRGEIQNFCLRCHASNGSQGGVVQDSGVTAPKVYINAAAGRGNAPANTDPFEFSLIGAGGDFSAVGTFDGTTFTLASGDGATNPSLGYGHSIGSATATPPGGTAAGGLAISGFTCTSCHDPHGRSGASGSGVNLYRNLKHGTSMDTQGFGMTNAMAGMSSYVGGIHGTNFAGDNSGASNHIWPVMKNAGTSQNVYNQGTAAGDQSTGTNFSNWCAQCHSQWHEVIVPANQSAPDWNRHPVDYFVIGNTSTSGAGVTKVDFTWYLNGDTNALAPNSPGGSQATKLPMISFGASTKYYGITGIGNGRVFCLSCHYAHGGPNFDALRWQHTSTVSAGNQTGLGVASNVGCQQCHNR